LHLLEKVDETLGDPALEWQLPTLPWIKLSRENAFIEGEINES